MKVVKYLIGIWLSGFTFMFMTATFGIVGFWVTLAFFVLVAMGNFLQDRRHRHLQEAYTAAFLQRMIERADNAEE